MLLQIYSTLKMYGGKFGWLYIGVDECGSRDRAVIRLEYVM